MITHSTPFIPVESPNKSTLMLLLRILRLELQLGILYHNGEWPREILLKYDNYPRQIIPSI